MRFYMPYADTPENGEAAYLRLRASTGAVFGESASLRRFALLKYSHNGREYFAEVGQVEQYHHDEVIAIFEFERFFVVHTRQTCLGRANPIQIRRDNVLGGNLFDDEPLKEE